MGQRWGTCCLKRAGCGPEDFRPKYTTSKNVVLRSLRDEARRWRMFISHPTLTVKEAIAGMAESIKNENTSVKR